MPTLKRGQVLDIAARLGAATLRTEANAGTIEQPAETGFVFLPPFPDRAAALISSP